MNSNVKLALTAVGVFAVAVSANIVAKSVYTNTKIGADKKALLIASAIGIGTTFLMVKVLKAKVAI